MAKMGKLYIVATPIGNFKDITLRAIEVLKSVDAVICENARRASTLLKKLELPVKELLVLDEHNEQTQAADIALRLVNGETMALVSDAGTPVFADPGHYLVRQAAEYDVQIVPLPGPSSVMAALSVLDFEPRQYYFGGFLSRNPDERRKELYHLRGLRVPVVLMDTPYRLGALLEDVSKVFGKGHPVTLATNLTQPKERIFRGSVADVAKEVQNRKAEFVLILHGAWQY
jgi:16S rRNA (cytidine1402-2'-O)-methyltransferase